MSHEVFTFDDSEPPEEFSIAAHGDDALKQSVGITDGVEDTLQPETETELPLEDPFENASPVGDPLDMNLDTFLTDPNEFDTVATHLKKKLAEHGLLTVRDILTVGRDYVQSIRGLFALEGIENALQRTYGRSGVWADKPTVTAITLMCDTLEQVNCGALWDYTITVRGCESLTVADVLGMSTTELAQMFLSKNKYIHGENAAAELQAKARVFAQDFAGAQAFQAATEQ